MLDARLSCCASFVRSGSLLADIGTDHAYLPIWLVQNKSCRSAIAADLRQGPLDSAQKNILSAGLQQYITTRLSDGLTKILPHEADDIVIAGMGGHLIASILEAAPWVKDPQKRLILQPMSDAPVVRRWLCENGFDILEERAVHCGKHLYGVMHVAYNATVLQPDEVFYRVGRMSSGGADEQAYIARELHRLQEKAAGLQKSKLAKQSTEDLQKMIQKIQTILQRMEEKA